MRIDYRRARFVRCWACEELLAFQQFDGALIVEADADVSHAADQQIIVCGCGARTELPSGWAPDDVHASTWS